MDEVQICRNTEGETVAEVDLDETGLTLTEIIGQARDRGADLVWAHGGDPGADGFVPQPGYAHLHAEDPLPGEPLPTVEPELYGALLGEAFAGMWGHKWVDRDQSLPTDGSVVLCLTEDGEAIGLCRVWPDLRLVDQPGVVPARREAAHTLRLLGAACALLGPGPVDVNTWGESAQTLDACRRLGFVVTEQLPGWELRLPRR